MMRDDEQKRTSDRRANVDRRPADTGTDLEAGDNMRFLAIPVAHNDAIVAESTCRAGVF